MSKLKKDQIKLPIVFFLLAVISTLIVGIEAVTYPHWLNIHLGFTPKFITLITLIMAVPIVFRLGKARQPAFIFLISSICFFVVMQFLLIYLESSHYPNYIYSRFHIQVSGFNNLLFHQVGLLMTMLLFNKGTITKLSQYLTRRVSIKGLSGRLLFFLVIIFVSLFAINNIPKDVAISGKLLADIAARPWDSNADKLRKIYGFYYDYIDFVKSRTEEGSIIAIPPTNYPWASEGNPAMDLYFIYPRKLVQGNGYGLPAEKVDYVMIARGSWPKEGYENGWPKERVYGEKIWYINETTLAITEYSNTFYRQR
jgi:hypothetical protein